MRPTTLARAHSTRSPSAGRLDDRARRLSPSCSTPPSPTAWCGGRRPNVRVRIFGPLEARLQSVDRAGARRPGRGRLAAGDARRSLAQPADAARARPRPAGAAHRAFRARLRAGARRARGHPDPRRQARPARRRWPRASCSGSRRSPARRAGRRRSARGEHYLAWARALDEPADAPKPVAAARAAAAARGAADGAQRHRDRALAARSLHDLRQAHPAAAAARRRRHAAGRGRPRHA